MYVIQINCSAIKLNVCTYLVKIHYIYFYNKFHSHLSTLMNLKINGFQIRKFQLGMYFNILNLSKIIFHIFLSMLIKTQKLINIYKSIPICIPYLITYK